jgi:WD40 repeat protein
VRVLDLAHGTPVGKPLKPRRYMPTLLSRNKLPQIVTCLATGCWEGHPVVVCGGSDGMVRVWDLARGSRVGGPFVGHRGWVSAVAVAQLEGRPVVVSGGNDGTVRVWDLGSSTPVGEPLIAHAGEVSALAIGELEGRPVVVSGGTDGMVRAWEGARHLLQAIDVGSEINALALAQGGICVLASAMGVMSLSLKSSQP